MYVVDAHVYKYWLALVDTQTDTVQYTVFPPILLAITIVFKRLSNAVSIRGRIVIEGDLFKTQPHARSINGLTLLIDTVHL